GRLRAHDTEPLARPPVAGGARAQVVRARGGMLGVPVLVRRHVAEHVEVHAVGPDPAVEQPLVVAPQEPGHEARAEVALLAAVPVVHERDGSLLPAPEARAREGLRRRARVLLVDGELRDLARALVERGEAVVLRGVLAVVAPAVLLEVLHHAHARERRADERAHLGPAGRSSPPATRT